MSTTLYAWDLASSNTRPALPVKSRTCPSLSCSSSPEAYSRTKRALCSSDSKPSSSVMNRIFTSGLYLSESATIALNQREISQDSRFTNAGQRSQAFAVDKHVHEVCTHVGRVKVKLKETMVVTEGQSRPHIQRVLYSQVRFICWG